MDELDLICKQPGPLKNKRTTVECPDIPNRLNRDFTVEAPNTGSGAAILLISVRGSRWVYLAVVIDLYARKIVGRTISNNPDVNHAIKALEDAYKRRGKPEGVLVPLGPGFSIQQYPVQAKVMALSF